LGVRLAIDFDGTIVERGAPLRPRPHALAVLARLKQDGHQLVLHSCRCNPRQEANPAAARAEADEFWRTGTAPPDVEAQWRGFAEMREFLVGLEAWDLFDVVWQGSGKPEADAYIDDRGESPQDWLAVWRDWGVQ
jgi:hypothetical protein